MQSDKLDNNSSNIFQTIDPNSMKVEYIKFAKSDVLSSIPKSHVKEEDKILKKTLAEWRWRIYKLPNKQNEVVEISYKKPNETRKYIDKFGNWIEYSMDERYDKYIIDKYFVYSLY